MKTMKGHVIRWMLILIMGSFIFISIYSYQPWSAESAIKESLHAMNMPGDVQEVDKIKVGKLYSVIFWDETHQMYHHSWMRHSLGMLWIPKGGGFGRTLKEDEWKIQFDEGYSQRSNQSYHYINGQVNDPRVATVEVVWKDGTKETMKPVIGRLIHFARVAKVGESFHVSLGLNAYDEDGELIYELDHDNNMVLTEEVEIEE